MAVDYLLQKTMGKNLSSKYGQKLDTTKKLVIDALITISKRVIQKPAAGDLVGNQIAENFTKATSKSTPEDPIKSMTVQKPPQTSIPEEIYIPPKKQQQIID